MFHLEQKNRLPLEVEDLLLWLLEVEDLIFRLLERNKESITHKKTFLRFLGFGRFAWIWGGVYLKCPTFGTGVLNYPEYGTGVY